MKIPEQPKPNTTEIWTDGHPDAWKEDWKIMVIVVLLGCVVFGILYAIAIAT